MMRGRSTDWRRFNSSVSAAWPAEVIGTLSIVFVLRSRMLWRACAQLLSDRAFVPPNAALKPAVCCPSMKGLATFIRGGEFQPYRLYCQPPRGTPPGRRSVFGKVTLKCADLKVSVEIGTEAL